MSDPQQPPADGMGRRFVRGALYIGVANWSTFAINFALGLAVARILGPQEFGLYAFVAAFNEFVNLVNCLAVAPALVQSREESEELYDTGYAISFAQAGVGLLISLIAAPLLAAHRSADAAWFLVLLGLARFPVLLVDVVMARLDRRQRFRTIAAIQLATRSLPNLACLGFALAGFGPWSLVLRDLLVGLIPLGVAHFTSGWWFRGRVAREAFRSIFAYSGPMFFARALDVFMTRFDRLMVGWFFDTRSVGLYHQSRFVAETGLIATAPVAQVTFNLYSRLQDDLPRLGRSYAIVTFFLVRIFFALAAALIVSAEEIVRLLLGEEWIDAAAPLRVLGLFLAAVTLLQNLQILIYARGAISAVIRMRLLQLGLLLPGALIAAWLGSLEGVAAVLLASTLLALALGWLLSLDVLRGAAPAIFGLPSLALLATVAIFRVLGPLPIPLAPWITPLLPPALFCALLLLVEARRILRELRYLRAQFSAPAASVG